MKHLLSFLLLLAIISASAQETTFSLQQAIEYAYQHQSSMLNAGLDEQMSHEKVKEIVGIGLPQKMAEIDVKHYFEIPTSLIPGEFFPGGTPAPILLSSSGTPYQASYGVSATQILFDPTYLVGVSASKTYRELSQKNLTRTRIETAVAVSKAYFQILGEPRDIQIAGCQPGAGYKTER
jgi:outer membrane protein TolC